MTDPLHDLSIGIAGEDTVDDRGIIGEREIHESTSTLSTDIVKMWSIPSYDHSECDDEVILLCFEKSPDHPRDLEGSRNEETRYIWESILDQEIPIGSFELLCEVSVEFSDNKSNTNLRREISERV
jgi:hypothetical protein